MNLLVSPTKRGKTRKIKSEATPETESREKMI